MGREPAAQDIERAFRVTLLEEQPRQRMGCQDPPLVVCHRLFVERHGAVSVVFLGRALQQLGENQSPERWFYWFFRPVAGATQGCEARSRVAAPRVPPCDDVSTGEEIRARSARQAFEHALRVVVAAESQK